MGMIEEVGTYLAASTLIGALGTDIFLNALPDSTRVTVALLEAPGGEPSYGLGGATVPIHTRASIDVLVRSSAGSAGYANPTNARVKLQRVWNRLSLVTNQTLSGSTYLRISPDDEPHLIDRDEQGRVIFGCSFTVMRRGTTGV
jgi:hypothetical protein